MGNIVPDTEVVELAIHREIEAYYFYMALSERVESDQMKDVFKEFAQEELGHKEKLELEILKIGQTYPIDQPLPEPNGPYIISNTDSPLNMDYKDILLLCIEKEDAAYRTYINLLPTVGDEQSRETLLAIAQQEVKHKLRFETEYELLIKDGK